MNKAIGLPCMYLYHLLKLNIQEVGIRNVKSER